MKILSLQKRRELEDARAHRDTKVMVLREESMEAAQELELWCTGRGRTTQYMYMEPIYVTNAIMYWSVAMCLLYGSIVLMIRKIGIADIIFLFTFRHIQARLLLSCWKFIDIICLKIVISRTVVLCKVDSVKSHNI